MIESNNEWIPLDQSTRDQLDDQKPYWVTSVGAQGKPQVTWGYGRLIKQSTNTIAVKAKECTPEPYVPPKPERREWWIVEMSHNANDDAYRVQQMDTSMRAIDQIHVREVLGGDPSPEMIEGVIREMKTAIEHGGASVNALRFWINVLEGK